MPIRRGIVASSITSLPTITINAVTNFNQDQATFNATVNPNLQTTSVKFQFKKTVDSTWTDGSTLTGLTGGSQSVYSNQTSLPTAGVSYDVRAVATNGIGTVISSSTSFTTWSLKNVGWTSNSSITIPTITPTGSSTIIPSLYDIFVVGGGGGCARGGGGGGQCTLVSSRAFINSSNLTVSGTIGGGGVSFQTALGNTPTAGSASTLSGAAFTSISGAGGGAANSTTGGSSGSGFGGGTGNTINDPAPKSIAFTTVGGGGGGSGGGGGNGSIAGNTFGGTAYGGNGGIGTLTQYGYYVGGGGGGGAANDGGSEFAGSAGAGGFGNGASAQAYNSPYDPTSHPDGSAGAIAFKYYGP